MTATLQRQDDGRTLVLDGLTRLAYDQRYLVAQHPGQDVATLTDGVQRLAAPVRLDWTCSESPTVPGLTTGTERYDEVLGWLREAVGVLLVYVDDRQIIPDLLLSGYPLSYAAPRAMQIQVELVTATIARTRTVGDAGVDPARARADVSSSRSATSDRGDVATTTPRQSLVAAALDLAGSALGVQ